MSKSGEDCTNAVIEQYTWIEESFAQDKHIDEICMIFEIDQSTLDKRDFFWFLSDIYTMGVQYGDRTGLCDMLIANKNEVIDLQLFEVAEYGRSKGISYYQYDAKSLQNETIDINSNLRQWTYQYCTEFGFFQTPRNEFTGMRSQVLHLPYWPDYCTRIFGELLPDNFSARTNRNYGGLDIKGKNIFFANAEEDPWQWAGKRELQDPVLRQAMTA